MHGLIQALVQAHKSFLTPLICTYKPPSGQLLLIPLQTYYRQECKGTPSGLFGNAELCATPYISIQTRMFMPLLRHFMMQNCNSLKLLQRVNQAQYHQITHANVHHQY